MMMMMIMMMMMMIMMMMSNGKSNVLPKVQLHVVFEICQSELFRAVFVVSARFELEMIWICFERRTPVVWGEEEAWEVEESESE